MKTTVFFQMVLRLLEAPHAVQDVELLPAFGEVDLPIDEVRVSQVHKSQVLENETPVKWSLWRTKSKIKGMHFLKVTVDRCLSF